MLMAMIDAVHVYTCIMDGVQGIELVLSELTMTVIGGVKSYGARELTDKDKWCWRDARGSSENYLLHIC